MLFNGKKNKYHPFLILKHKTKYISLHYYFSIIIVSLFLLFLRSSSIRYVEKHEVFQPFSKT